MKRLKRIWLEVFHTPTDGRLDYCECGESWPCSLRRKWMDPNQSIWTDENGELDWSEMEIEEKPIREADRSAITDNPKTIQEIPED